MSEPVGTVVPERYLLKSASGSQSRDDYVSDYGSAVIGHVLMGGVGGSLVVDPMTGAVTGAMSGTETLVDNFCNGLSFRSSYGGSTVSVSFPVSGATIEAFLVAGGVQILTPTVKRYTVPPRPASGYVVTYCGNGVWGSGTLTETLSNRMTVAQAAAAGGAGLIPTTFRSAISGFDTGTGIMVGESTEISIGYAHPSVSGEFLVVVTYSVELIGGGPVTTLIESYVELVGVGGHLSLDVIIPNKVGYTVTLSSVTVQDIYEITDDFEQGVDRTWLGNVASNYVTTPTWPQLPTFGMPLPATECGSDWEDVTATTGFILNDPWGYYWAGQGTFLAADNVEVSDDFEAYVGGTLGFWSRGLGWGALGYFQTGTYPEASDDFETYAVGVITSLNNEALTGNQNWAADGTFHVDVYTTAYDEFEGYPTGVITSLNAGTGWFANGTFG